MTEAVRKVNSFLRTATRAEVDEALGRIILSERQMKVFDLCCMRRLGIGFAADTLNVCPMVINTELRAIRMKILKVL